MTTFEIAMNEYSKEDEDGQFKIIYTYFGLAIYQAQCLEETFTIMLCTNKIIKKNIKTSQDVNEIIDSIENSKKTMGNFIHEVKRNYDLTDEVENSLTEILKKRNYLIHKYFKLEIAKLYSNQGRREMLHFLSTFVDDIIELDKKLEKYYEQYKTKIGITDKDIERLMEDIKSTGKDYSR